MTDELPEGWVTGQTNWERNGGQDGRIGGGVERDRENWQGNGKRMGELTVQGKRTRDLPGSYQPNELETAQACVYHNTTLQLYVGTLQHVDMVPHVRCPAPGWV